MIIIISNNILNLLTKQSNYGYTNRKISEKNGCGIASI